MDIYTKVTYTFFIITLVSLGVIRFSSEVCEPPLWLKAVLVYVFFFSSAVFLAGSIISIWAK